MDGLFKLILLPFFILAVCNGCFAQDVKHPNVILIIADDLGYGDLGITGNPYVKTPVIDKFAIESIRFYKFYVSPVCALTRSSLMTGRYSLRTGIRDTYNGGATMATSEITIAEMLKQANYATGIFGKWHLGDNYPCRPKDQGFDESLIHLSGGMAQVGDVTTFFKGDSSYFNPVLWHNNKQESYKGYCSDIFSDQAIEFININHKKPFFCYLSFNAPHTPLQVPDSYLQKYKAVDPSVGFENNKMPFTKMSEQNKQDARKVYAMVTNIDDNIGKLLKRLDELKIAENTIVIFMSDNGPQSTRYNAGLNGLKGSVFQGGVRVPFYIRYPAKFKSNTDIETAACHMDILPTLAQLCKVKTPVDRIIDGKTLLPLLKNEQVGWTNRSLFFYWTRRYPELYNNIALQKGKYSLIGNTDYNANILAFKLYDLEIDPYQQRNIINEKTTIAVQLKAELDSKFRELIASPNLINPPLVIVGSKYENPVILNRNDAGGSIGIWDQEEIYGSWKVSLLEGFYNIKFKFIKPVTANGQMSIEAKTFITQVINEKADTDIIEMKNVFLPAMNGDFVPYYSTAPGRGVSKRILPFSVEIEKIK